MTNLLVVLLVGVNNARGQILNIDFFIKILAVTNLMIQNGYFEIKKDYFLKVTNSYLRQKSYFFMYDFYPGKMTNKLAA